METLEKIEDLANLTLNKTFEVVDVYGTLNRVCIRDEGYTFKFDHAKKRFGCCDYGKKTISLSKHLCEANPHQINAKIKDTILHEIAHAISVILYGKKHGKGHDQKWVSIAKQIGCNGNRCYTLQDFGGIKKPESKYTGVCNSCGNEISYHRRPKLSRSCGKCAPKKFNKDFLIEIKQNY